MRDVFTERWTCHHVFRSDWNTRFVKTSITISIPLCSSSYSLCSSLTPLCFSPSPFFSISFGFSFPKLAAVGVADFLQSRTFSVGSFVSLFIIPQKAPQASCEAVGSIHSGGLSLIVIHPRGWTLLIECFLLYTQCEWDLTKTKCLAKNKKL